MTSEANKEFGSIITKIMTGEDLSREETKHSFYQILNDEISQMQQGAFLSALTAKGETKEEIAGAWEAIYDLDTNKVFFEDGTKLVENCGTGMDTLKTFNISTAASLGAASAGIKMARHGARAISSNCGTVDIAEALGVDVECDTDLVKKSIIKSNIGLFNGMSQTVHPRALGRILSQIFFGTTLNISGSLANPAQPNYAVRGVYKKEMILPVINVMKEIGYKQALVLFGAVRGSEKGMDEASVCGTTYCAELDNDGTIREFSFEPEELGLGIYDPIELEPLANKQEESKQFLQTIQGKGNRARIDAFMLNAALILYLKKKVSTIEDGIKTIKMLTEEKAVLKTLEKWVQCQNSDPKKGLKRLNSLLNDLDKDKNHD